MLNDTIAMVLAAGQGSRLQPLTSDRTKAAVPYGGKYRLIDFSLANCLHSGLRRILVLTQYKSHSLQKHLRDGWSLFNPELGEYITVVPAQMRTGDGWYAGTADAVYQNLYMIRRSGARKVLVLPGDHVYRMDYAAMAAFHEANSAELTLACTPVPAKEAGRFGILSVNGTGRVQAFEEKPDIGKTLAPKAETLLASMGVYLFSTEFLFDTLSEDRQREGSSHDFGRDVIPRLIETSRCYAYRFGGATGRVSQDRYWKNIETLDDYYEANMELLALEPPLDLYQPDWPIRTYQAQHPPTRTVPGVLGTEGLFINSIVAGGVLIVGGAVQGSILFPQVRVGEEAMVHDSILFENVSVGEGARLERCIIDKDVKVPPGEKIGIDRAADRARFTVTEKGVVVVPKGCRFD